MAYIERQKQQAVSVPKLVVLLQWIGSLKLAVVMMVVLAGVLALATFMEAAQGRDYSQWYVYHSSWFIALLGLLATNILAATLIRYPWGYKRLGFLLAHAGLLALLAGSIATFMGGVEGSITFKEGDTAREILLPDFSRFTASWPKGEGARPNMSSVFAFRPGPVEWPEGKTLDLGSLGGVGLKILRYYPHAQVEENWQADTSKGSNPAMEFSLVGPDGSATNQSWLVSTPFGGQIDYGPLSLELHQAGADTQVEDFFNPPATDDMDKDGVLSMHYEGKMQRIAVSENIGKKVPLGESGLAVEIVEYLPNAQPSSGGKFSSSGDEPKNPFLELRIYVPGKDTPQRQIAFARQPSLSLDVIHGWNCPVKFWYHHKSITAPTGISFLQTPAGKLCCRVGKDGKYESKGEVKEGAEIAITDQFKIRILKYLPSAQRQVKFTPAATDPGESSSGEAAALVEVNVEGASKEVWMCRTDPEFGRQQIDTAEGPLQLTFGYEYIPLEFSLKLLSFTRGMNPGQMGDASFASKVRLINQTEKIDQEREISMNQPLIQGKYVFYQSSYEDLPDGTKISALSVAYDPGRSLKHIGCILLCVGTFVMFYMRSSLTKILSGFSKTD